MFHLVALRKANLCAVWAFLSAILLRVDLFFSKVSFYTDANLITNSVSVLKKGENLALDPYTFFGNIFPSNIVSAKKTIAADITVFDIISGDFLFLFKMVYCVYSLESMRRF